MYLFLTAYRRGGRGGKGRGSGRGMIHYHCLLPHQVTTEDGRGCVFILRSGWGMSTSYDNHVTGEVPHHHRQSPHVTGNTLSQYLHTPHKGLRTRNCSWKQRNNGSLTRHSPNKWPDLPLVEHGLATRISMGGEVGDSGYR